MHKPVNGTGATAGKSPRDYLRERAGLSQDARRHAHLPRWPLILGLRKLSR